MNIDKYANNFKNNDTARDTVLSMLNDIKSDGSIPENISAHAAYLLEWLELSED